MVVLFVSPAVKKKKKKWNPNLTLFVMNTVEVSCLLLCCANFSALKSAVTCAFGQGKTSQPIHFGHKNDRAQKKKSDLVHRSVQL